MNEPRPQASASWLLVGSGIAVVVTAWGVLVPIFFSVFLTTLLTTC